MALINFEILLVTWILFTSLYDVTRASSEPSVFYIVDEEQPIGTLIGDVRKDATLDTEFNDRDLRTATFHFLTPRPTMFQVDVNTGQVRTTERLDRETLCPTVVYCSLSAELAVQGAANFKVVIVKMVVTVLDINDNAPAFPTPKVSVGISEAAAVGTALTLPSAIDPDTLQFGVKEYRLVTSSHAASGSGVFELQVAKKNDGSTDVRLVLAKSLDRETASEHAVRIVAVDGGSPALSGTLEVTVDVRDANDHSPVFDQPSYQTSVSEDVPIRTNILRVHASDGDAGVNGRIVYALSEQTMKSFGRTFAIDNTTGVVYNLQNLDFETASSYALYIKAYDQGSEPLVAEVPVTIDVDDVNDNAPEITVSALYTSPDGEVVQVPENMAPGGFVAQVIVNDRDTSGDNGKVNCTMNDPYFRFSRRSDGKYQLLTTVTLDRERRDSYNLRVICQDRGSPPLSSVRDISIAVLDDNDNGPVFERSRYEATMIERNYEEAFVIKVNATDLDIGRNGEIAYRLSDKAAPYFQIDQQTGVIKAVTSLDRERTPRLTFEVFASDGGATPRRNTSVEVTVTVLDVNDEKPQFALPGYYFTVVENSKAGKIIGNVSATDGDSEPNALITYSLSLTGSAIGMFFIDPTTGVISLTRAPDREMTARHYFTVLARDSGSPSLTGSASVTVSVGDVNDNAPIFRFPSGLNSSLVIPNDHPPGYVFSKVDAFDVDDGENGRLTYVISGGSDERNYFSIDSQYGAVMVNMDLSHVAYETITLEIVAKDNGQPQLSTTAVLVVIVNRSLAALTTARNRGVSGMLLAGHNLTVMLALVALTILVIVLLVTTVACLKCNDKRRKAARYNCRMETIRALTGSGSSTSIKRGADGVGVVVMEAGAGGMMRHHGVTSSSDGVCDRLLKQDHQYGGCDDGFDKIRVSQHC
jgi:protocadherin delta 1